MIGVDLERLRALYEDNLELRVYRRSPEAISLLRRVTTFLAAFYRVMPPESIPGTLYVISAHGERPAMNGVLTHVDGPIQRLVAFPAIVWLDDRGGYQVNPSIVNVPDDIFQHELVYVLDEQAESLFLQGERLDIPNVAPSACRSVFARPTFWELEEALEIYHQDVAQLAVGPQMESCWREPQRLRWVNAPEHLLRDSLWYYLSGVLRGGADVDREQTVDARHPVDIKITWVGSVARALIEIKWLGISVDEEGNVTSVYTSMRAIKGAVQLRRYIASYLREHREHKVIGYLVAFDGRRRNVRTPRDDISLTDLVAYMGADIPYPAKLAADTTLRLGYRFFVEPDTSDYV